MKGGVNGDAMQALDSNIVGAHGTSDAGLEEPCFGVCHGRPLGTHTAAHELAAAGPLLQAAGPGRALAPLGIGLGSSAGLDGIARRGRRWCRFTGSRIKSRADEARVADALWCVPAVNEASPTPLAWTSGLV